MSVKIQVTESGTTSPQQATNGPQIPNTPQTGGNSGAVSIKSAKTIAAASILGKGAISYGISNIGKYTGSTATQTKINNGMEIAGMVGMAALNPGLGIANLALKVATSALDEIHRVKWETIEVNQARARAGYKVDSYNKGR